jgi:general stress protein 26
MSRLQGRPDRVWSQMEELRVAMVVTHEGASGRLRGRPMAAHPAPQENAICFLTDSRATKDVEIIANNNV